MTKTFATLFSGGGVADVGIQAAGYRHLWGIELDDAIASTARANGFGVITADVLDVDPRTLEAPDYLHASPVCTRASQANQTAAVNERGTKEAQLDLDMAAKVCEFIDVLKPRAFSLENVYMYRKFDSFQMILAALTRNGYSFDYANINAASFGVPQTRRRLILRAIRGGLLRQLPAPVPWVGWYAAIEDLLPTLPESKFAPWQLARLPNELQAVLIGGGNRSKSFLEFAKLYRKTIPGQFFKEEPSPSISATASSDMRAFIMPNENSSSAVVRFADEPASTVGATERVGNAPRAFIVNGVSRTGAPLTVRNATEPVHTITATSFRREGNIARAWLSSGRVVKMTPRALARFQSIPDSYQLPAKDALAVKIIGNGYPSLLAQRIAENLQ